MDVLHEDLLHRLLQSLPGRAWRSLGAATPATRSALRSFLAERNQVKLTQMAFRCAAGDVGDVGFRCRWNFGRRKSDFGDGIHFGISMAGFPGTTIPIPSHKYD